MVGTRYLVCLVTGTVPVGRSHKSINVMWCDVMWCILTERWLQLIWWWRFLRFNCRWCSMTFHFGGFCVVVVIVIMIMIICIMLNVVRCVLFFLFSIFRLVWFGLVWFGFAGCSLSIFFLPFPSLPFSVFVGFEWLFFAHFRNLTPSFGGCGSRSAVRGFVSWPYSMTMIREQRRDRGTPLGN